MGRYAIFPDHQENSPIFPRTLRTSWPLPWHWLTLQISRNPDLITHAYSREYHTRAGTA